MADIFDSLTPFEVLTLTIIGEARGEPIESQVGVGCVIRNRLLMDKYKDYKDVCLRPNQFSCWNPKDVNRNYLLQLASQMLKTPFADLSLKQCQFIANGIVSWQVADNVNGARFYIENTVFAKIGVDPNLDWAKGYKNIAIRGHHTFFSL